MPHKRKFAKKLPYKRQYKRSNPLAYSGQFKRQAKGPDILSQAGMVVKARAADKYLVNGAWMPTYFCRHRYVERFTMSGTIGGVTAAPYVFRLNSVFDPYAGVGGRRPSGYTEIAAMYNQYCVYGVTIRCQVYAQTSGTVALVWRIADASDSSNFTGLLYENFQEAPNAGACVCNISTAGMNVTDIDLGYISIAQIEGTQPSRIMQENDYSALATTNPAVFPQLQLGVVDLSLANNPTLTVIVSIVYHTRWTGRKVPTISS